MCVCVCVCALARMCVCVDPLLTTSIPVILSICVTIYLNSSAKKVRLTMDKFHHYTLFDRTSYRTVLSQHMLLPGVFVQL